MRADVKGGEQVLPVQESRSLAIKCGGEYIRMSQFKSRAPSAATILRIFHFHCCDLRLVTTALNLETSVMSCPVNTIVLPLGRSTPGR